MHIALSDADARGSVRYVESEVTPTTKATLTNDIAVHEGRQNITYSGGVQGHVLLVDGVAYLSGNQAALINYFGFPAAAARHRDGGEGRERAQPAHGHLPGRTEPVVRCVTALPARSHDHRTRDIHRQTAP
jgi:hypothetical protein